MSTLPIGAHQLDIGLQVPFDPGHIARALAIGVQSIQLRIGPGFPIETGDEGLNEACAAAATLSRRGLRVTSLGYYRNMLDPDEQLRAGEAHRLRNVFRMAREVFECDLVGVFAGRQPELSVEDNIPLFREVWEPLADAAGECGVRIAFENCTMYRGYPVRGINMSHSPHAYTLMFEALPHGHLGIEFDPSHCVKQLIDPVDFLRAFPGRIFHLHAKDHERLPEEQQRHGCFDVRCSRDRFPGFGQVNFAAIVGELRRQNYAGPITIEGERDPDFTSEEQINEALRSSRAMLERLTAGLGE